MFSVFNNYTAGPALTTSFLANFTTTNSGTVSISKAYKNIIQQGQYFYYKLQPDVTYGLNQLQALTINVVSLVGDADLVVSVTNMAPMFNQGNFESISINQFDSITLNTTGNFTLNQTIVIGVYGFTTATYELTFEPVYVLDYNLKLDSAVSLVDSIPKYNYFL
jgi:hypothetical protein